MPPMMFGPPQTGVQRHMKEKIDTIEAGNFFKDAQEEFAALHHYFREFRQHLVKYAEGNVYFDWKVSDLAGSKRSFEVEYMTLKVRAVFSIRPAVDKRGVITFYLLDDFEPSAKLIDSFDYSAEHGETSVKNLAGADRYIEHHSHQLMTQIFYQAYRQA